MSKITKAITLDPEVVDGIKELRLNLSGEINEFLKSLITKYTENVDEINAQIERISLEKAIKKVNYWQKKVKIHQIRLEKWEENAKKSEEERLKAEKEEIEAKKMCKNCGKTINPEHKSHEFPIGIICHSCFMVVPPMQTRKWMQDDGTPAN